jgi:hypothetical protein
MTNFLIVLLLAGAPTPKTPAAETPAAKAKAALDETTAVVFENKTLPEFLDYLKAKVRVEVMLDRAVCQQFMLPEQEIRFSANIREASLREGLETALAPLGLKVGTVGGTIVISTEEGLVVRQMKQKVSVSSGTAGDVLQRLKARTGANIVVDPRHRKKLEEAACELDLSHVPLETAVRLTAEVSGYRALRMGNVLFITTNERAKELRADADDPVGSGGSSHPILPFVEVAPGVQGLGGVAPAIPAPAGNPPPPPER